MRTLLAPRDFPMSDWGYYQRTGCGACISGRKRLAVTCDGEVMFCYNSMRVIGDLADDSLESVFNKSKEIWAEAYDPKCETCTGKEFCYWGCRSLYRDKDNHAINCERFRIPFFGILREESKRLYTPLTKDEVAWFSEQNEIVKQEVQLFLQEGQKQRRGRLNDAG